MSETATRRLVLAFVPDLFFASKLAATAEAGPGGAPGEAGSVRLELLAAGALIARCAPEAAAGPGRPALVILDLGAGEPALAIARALAATGIPTLGFYSHVDTATRDAALAAGVGTVLPRSAFVAQLPRLLFGG